MPLSVTAPGPRHLTSLQDRRNLGDEVTHLLREQLVAGRFEAGARLGIDELASELGVSTMPVREALTTLATEGFLEALPRRGFRVVPMRLQDVQDSWIVHAYVSGLLAGRAASQMTDGVLATLGGIQAQLETLAADIAEREARSPLIEDLNYRFHRTVNLSCDATRLRWFLRATTRYHPRHEYSRTAGWYDMALADHRVIIAALAQHDADAARRHMEDHVLRTAELSLAAMAERQSA